MSINYQLLKESKEELLSEITDFFQHVISLNELVFNKYLKKEKVDDKFLNEIENREEQSDILYNDVMNSVIWAIQTNSPRASNLRFVVSCLNAAKELEKASDYIYDLALILNTVDFEHELFNDFMDSFLKCNEIVNNAYKLFLEQEMSETKKEIQELLKEYEVFLSKQVKSTISYLSKTKNVDEQQLINWVKSYNFLEKIIIHIYNLIKAFNYIDLKRH